MSNIITKQVFDTWFSSFTNCDPQLKSFLASNKFENKTPTYTEICNTLFGCDNPYDNYSYDSNKNTTIKYDAHISHKTIDIIIAKLGRSPKLGIEVGSFIGSSAVILSKQLLSDNGILLCIDTWCGDINMWLLDVFCSVMNKNDSNPKIFDHFMHTVIANQLTNKIIPIRISSIIGARMLKVLNYTIDFVYLDSAHEAGETFMELMLYHDVLKQGGILFGDDYNMFPAVKHDVDLFCNYFGYTLLFTGDGDTWLIQK